MKKESENKTALLIRELEEMISVNDPGEMAENFMLVHEIALYHSDYPIDAKEKTALFQLRELAELFKRYAREITEKNN